MMATESPPVSPRPLDAGDRFRRLSPALVRRVGQTGARARLQRELRSIAIDLIGPRDGDVVGPEAAAWVDEVTEAAVAAVGDLSLGVLAERLDAVLAEAPGEVSRRLDSARARREAGIF